MIIRLKRATFTTNIGTLDSWSIRTSVIGGSLTQVPSITSIQKDSTTSTVLTYKYDATSYEVSTVTVTSNNNTVGSVDTNISGEIKVTIPAGNTLSAAVQININLSAIGGGGSETTYYTITYKYMSGSTSIKTQFTEQVVAGTIKTFSTSGAPTISGYAVSNVNPSGQQIINSDITVTYNYIAVQPGEVTVVVETGSPVAGGYYGSIPINGFAPALPIDSFPNEIDGVRFYMSGVTAGDVKEMTALIGYFEGGSDGVPTVIKSTTKAVTLPAAKTWTTATDFPLHVTKEEILAATAGKTDVAIAIGCYHSDLSDAGKAYTVGFRNCSPAGISGTEAADYKGGYFYLGKWAVNSAKQHMYAALLTGDIETVTHTITYEYKANGVEVAPSTTETVYHNEIKKFSKDTAPAIYSWTCASVSVPQVTVTSDIVVTYEYERPVGNFSLLKSGAKQTTGYQSTNNLGINGFGVSLDKNLLDTQATIKGITAYLAGPTKDEVINMTAFIGYAPAPYTTSSYRGNELVILRSTTKDVTMTGPKDFSVATNFDMTISVAELLEEIGDGLLYVGWYPTDLDTYASYDIGAVYCASTSENEVNMAGDNALYHYQKGWSVNSKRQHIYADIYSNFND